MNEVPLADASASRHYVRSAIVASRSYDDDYLLDIHHALHQLAPSGTQIHTLQLGVDRIPLAVQHSIAAAALPRCKPPSSRLDAVPPLPLIMPNDTRIWTWSYLELRDIHALMSVCRQLHDDPETRGALAHSCRAVSSAAASAWRDGDDIVRYADDNPVSQPTLSPFTHVRAFDYDCRVECLWYDHDDVNPCTALLQTLRTDHLREFRFRNCSCTCTAFRQTLSQCMVRTLDTLVLENLDHDQCEDALARATATCRLRKLVLRRAFISEEMLLRMVRHAGDVLRHLTLEAVDSLTDRLLHAISRYNAQIEVLQCTPVCHDTWSEYRKYRNHMTTHNFSHAGVHELVQHCPRLRVLGVAHSEITDRTLNVIGRHLPALQQLDVQMCYVRRSAVRAFQARHPQCRVHFGYWDAFPGEYYTSIMHNDPRDTPHTEVFFQHFYCTCEDAHCICFPDNHAALADRERGEHEIRPLPPLKSQDDVEDATLDRKLELRLRERAKWCSAPRCRALRWDTLLCNVFGGTSGFCEFHTRNGIYFTENHVKDWIEQHDLSGD